MLRRMLLVFAAVTLMLAAAVPASAQGTAERGDRELPDSIAGLRLDAPVTAKIDSDLLRASGPQRVIVRLVDGAVAEAPAISKTLKAEKVAGQDDFLQRAAAAAPSGRVLARTQLVLNAVFMEVDASQIAALAADPDVVSVHRVKDYQLDLSETVPYIGATAAQNAGFDGTGVKVAVLDSGVDYTHANLGGGGTLADYDAAYGDNCVFDGVNVVCDTPRYATTDGLFPTAKVVDGYDFVGEAWPNAAEAPDPDPIDYEGHGTHVADIIGGVNGVAPGADIVAVKVCSAVSSSCSGIALIQGMEFAVDPNGDGDPSDAVDIINMSLGADYGSAFDDDLSLAVDNATALGVLTVSSAGNGSDKPFKTGTPSNAPTALSVAQTQVPSASLQIIAADGVEAPAVFQPWSVMPVAAISGVLQYADGAGGNLEGCDPFAAGSLTGLVVLVDRGSCNFTLKIKNIGDAGGAVGIIGLVAPGAPFSGGDGGDAPITIPGYMISQADSSAMKAIADGVLEATVDPANGIPLIGQMVGSSSRGPSLGTAIVKPEIGAPGASVSAIAGTGSDEGPFGGTSGASPMVAGSAALVLDAFPNLSPPEVKARLVNTGETDIDTDPFTGLAPISRIGGGEVRVDAALHTPAAAWDADSLLPTLSFGQMDVYRTTMRQVKMLNVTNYSKKWQKYYIEPSFRYEDDELSGAVEVKVSRKWIVLAPGQSKQIKVKLKVHADKLPGNFVSSGADGANPDALTATEFDGYINLIPKRHYLEPIHVPWHVLPRPAAVEYAKPWWRLHIDDTGVGEVELVNRGAGAAQNNLYSLIGVSPNMPEGEEGGQAPTPDLKAIGVQTFPVPAGFCSANDSFLWVFGSSTWERKTHTVPETWVQWTLDTNQDGVADYNIFDFDLSLSGSISDGRSVTWVEDIATGAASAFFFVEHTAFSGTISHVICAEQIGLSGADLLTTNVDVLEVTATDWYYGGPGDIIEGPITITPYGERYFGSVPDVPGKSSDSFEVFDFGVFPGNTPDLGIMITTDSDRGAGLRGGSVQILETLILPDKYHAKYVWLTLGGKLAM